MDQRPLDVLQAGRTRAGCEEISLSREDLAGATVSQHDSEVDVRVADTTYRLRPRLFAGPGPCYGLKIVGVRDDLDAFSP